MGCCRLHIVVDPPFSRYGYVLYNYDQCELLQVQFLLDELAGMHHASVQELVGCYVIYCQLLCPTQVAISVLKTC